MVDEILHILCLYPELATHKQTSPFPGAASCNVDFIVDQPISLHLFGKINAADSVKMQRANKKRRLLPPRVHVDVEKKLVTLQWTKRKNVAVMKICSRNSPPAGAQSWSNLTKMLAVSIPAAIPFLGSFSSTQSSAGFSSKEFHIGRIVQLSVIHVSPQTDLRTALDPCG